MHAWSLAWSVPLVFLLCGLALLLAARYGFPSRHWGRALCLLGAGYGLMLVHTDSFSAIKPLGEDALILFGVRALGRALLRRFDLAPAPRREMAVIAITLGAAALALALAHSPRLETVAVQGGCVLLAAMALRASWSRGMSRADHLLLDTIATLTLILAGQCVAFLLLARDTGTFVGAWQASAWGSMIQFTGLIISILLSFAVILALSLDFIETYRAFAHLDPLSRSLNRRGLEAFFLSHRRGALATRPAALLLADIDHFKRINDSYGHQVGDAVIVGFAQILQRHCAATGCTARIGGEEFVMLLPDTPHERALAIAEAVRRHFHEQGCPGTPARVSLTVSFGVIALLAGEDLESAIARADTHLYAAKRDGRNQVVPGPATP